MEDELQADDINEVPELVPVELPGRNIAPSLEERMSQVEAVLKINP